MTPPVQLREYQVAAIAAVQSAFTQVDRTLIESATGTGKTTIFSELARRLLSMKFRRALVIAHRRELITQAADRLRAFGFEVGIERGKQFANSERVVVASVQTLRAARLASFPMDEFDIIIIDEAHHAVADGYRSIIAHFPKAKVLGVTATPDRADGIALGNVFQSCAFRYGIADAVRDGHLVPARGLRVEVPGMDLSKVRQQRFVTDAEGKIKKLKTPVEGWGTDTGARDDGESRNLHETDLGLAVLAPEAVDGVVVPLIELAAARKTVVFAVNRAHAKALTDALQARGATAAYIDGVIHAGEREEAKRKHRAGEIQFLVNVMVLTEGYDDPSIECVAIARPSQSRVFYAQAIGRGLRLLGKTIQESTAAGKWECLVLDFVGVSCEFTLAGPADVLEGALVEPVAFIPPMPEIEIIEGEEIPEVEPASEPAPVAPAAPAKPITFKTTVVDIMRGAGRAAKKAATKAGGWLKNLLAGD